MRLLTSITAAPLLILTACATTGPSKQLVDARQAYENARTSPAAEYKPDAVLTAQQALERAEQAHDDDPGSFREQSLAYVAEREAEKAYSWGQYEQGVHAIEQAEQDYKRKQAQLLDEAKREKQDVENSLEQTREQLSTQESRLDKTQTELSQERRARQEAEKRADAAIESLKEVARVKDEARGTVITLDGAVLFLTGKSELLPLAKRKLDDVAAAIKDMGGDQKIVVEGHTDSRGSAEDNMELSRERAESVRQYLVSQGVDSGRVSAVGRGETQPVATNDTPEGRANNRRVEIIIQHDKASPAANEGSAPKP